MTGLTRGRAHTGSGSHDRAHSLTRGRAHMTGLTRGRALTGSGSHDRAHTGSGSHGVGLT